MILPMPQNTLIFIPRASNIQAEKECHNMAMTKEILLIFGQLTFFENLGNKIPN